MRHTRGIRQPRGIDVRTWLARIQAGRVAQLSGLVFIPAGLVKFVFHAWELKAFRDFGIPAASIMEPIVGMLETLGGFLLIKRTLIVPTAFVLAVIMLVAFVTGGLIHASPIPSDTLAPALLVAMVYLIITELRPPRPAPRLHGDRPHPPSNRERASS
jgi:uncharacterized membrane protein YphA (DoxX/SURF4 family)